MVNGQFHASAPLTPWKEPPPFPRQFLRRFVGPRADVHAIEKITIFALAGNLIPAVQSEVHRHADWAIPAVLERKAVH
jgi:hypothetical protein